METLRQKVVPIVPEKYEGLMVEGMLFRYVDIHLVLKKELFGRTVLSEFTSMHAGYSPRVAERGRIWNWWLKHMCAHQVSSKPLQSEGKRRAVKKGEKR